MDEDTLVSRVLHLWQVEKLSQRQIAKALGIDRKKVRRIVKGTQPLKAIPKKGLLDQYLALIAQWYKEYPRLMAKQVYQRLQGYGYEGSYKTVLRLSRQFRKIKQDVYHPLTFLRNFFANLTS